MPKKSMNQEWRDATSDDTPKEKLLLETLSATLNRERDARESLMVVSSENKALKAEVEYLKLKIEAMEIADRMTMNHLRTLEKDKEALLEALKQNSKPSEADSSGVVRPDAKMEQTE